MARRRGTLGDDTTQDEVYGLMRDRLYELFGPGGSFRITLGRANDDESIFVSTVADTIAWDVAGVLTSVPATDEHSTGSHATAAEAFVDGSDDLWRHIEAEVLSRRTVDGETTPVSHVRAA